MLLLFSPLGTLSSRKVMRKCFEQINLQTFSLRLEVSAMNLSMELNPLEKGSQREGGTVQALSSNISS